MVHPVDIHVGQNVKTRRRAMGLTQLQLAETLGISGQQMQKYESGQTRVSASRLYEISRELGVGVSHFYEGLEGCQGTAYPTPDKEAMQMSELLSMFKNRKVRAQFEHLIKEVASSQHL